MEQIPENILEWIEHIPFNQLQEEQQKEVLLYLTKAEYMVLHESARTTKEILMEEAADIYPSQEMAEKLMSDFDMKQHKAKTLLIPLWERRIPFWQMAASWLLIAGAMWLVLQSRYAGNTGINTSLATDTIYIEKIAEVTPQLIHDTVYLIEKAVEKAVADKPTLVKQEEFSSPPVYSENNTIKYPLTTAVPGMHILSIRDKDNALNNKSGIPVLDDTLVKKHGFVTL